MPGSKSGLRVCVLAIGTAALAAAVSPARAADDGYANVFSSVLGSVGLIKGDAAPVIQYRERPPLVLPKDATLPKPAAAGLKRTAAWPQDPDVLKERKEREEAHAPHAMDSSDKVGLLTHDEVMKGRIADEGPVRPNECGNDNKQCDRVSPAVLKEQFERYKAENPDKADTLVAGQEPTREFLTQPPKGYMKPVKAVKATTEAPEEKIDEASPRYMREQELKHQQEQLQ